MPPPGLGSFERLRRQRWLLLAPKPRIHPGEANRHLGSDSVELPLVGYRSVTRLAVSTPWMGSTPGIRIGWAPGSG